MHNAACPACGKSVELDFKPVSGLVWCPKCQKLFSPPAESDRESGETEWNGASEERDGSVGP
jgi:uncharacterized Zn finger protein (UPF0148 family)